MTWPENDQQLLHLAAERAEDDQSVIARSVAQQLKRPQLRSFPTIAGLFMLLRGCGLAVGETKPKRVVKIDPEMLEHWTALTGQQPSRLPSPGKPYRACERGAAWRRCLSAAERRQHKAWGASPRNLKMKIESCEAATARPVLLPPLRGLLWRGDRGVGLALGCPSFDIDVVFKASLLCVSCRVKCPAHNANGVIQHSPG